MKKYKTHSQTHNVRSFDWNKALSKPKITEKQWKRLIEKASSWITCACGNQCAIIPRDEAGCPEDSRLAYLGGGGGFYGAIKEHDAETALYFLNKIEERSAQLIKEIEDNGKTS